MRLVVTESFVPNDSETNGFEKGDNTEKSDTKDSV
jgi:hypothetical protein